MLPYVKESRWPSDSRPQLELGIQDPRKIGPQIRSRGFRIPNSLVPPKWILESIKICGFHALHSGFQSPTFAGFWIPLHQVIHVDKTASKFAHQQT